MAHVLAALGVRHGMVVYGRDGSDEISAAAPTTICEFTPGSFETYEVRPEDFTLPVAARQELEGGVPKDNASSRGAFLMGKRAEPGRPFYSMPVLASILAVRLLICLRCPQSGPNHRQRLSPSETGRFHRHEPPVGRSRKNGTHSRQRP